MRPRRSGQAILLFIVLIGVAGGLLGLALDGSRAFEEKRRVQSMADAAAIGAALEMKSSSSEAAWTQAAMDDVRINGFRDDSDQISVTRFAAGPDQDGDTWHVGWKWGELRADPLRLGLRWVGETRRVRLRAPESGAELLWWPGGEVEGAGRSRTPRERTLALRPGLGPVAIR